MELPQFTRAALFVVAFTLTGCGSRDPASEDRVEPADGQYEIKYEVGGAIGALMPTTSGPGSKPKTVCVRNASGVTFAEALPKGVAWHPSCTHSPAPRQGNAMSGTMTCPMDPQRAPGGRLVVDYHGAVAEDGVTVDMTTRVEVPQSVYASMSEEEAGNLREAFGMIESLPMKIVATRTGDCPG